MPRSEKVRLYNESVFSVLGESILSLLKLELYQEVRRLDDFLPSSIFPIAVGGELPISIDKRQSFIPAIYLEAGKDCCAREVCCASHLREAVRPPHTCLQTPDGVHARQAKRLKNCTNDLLMHKDCSAMAGEYIWVVEPLPNLNEAAESIPNITKILTLQRMEKTIHTYYHLVFVGWNFSTAVMNTPDLEHFT